MLTVLRPLTLVLIVYQPFLVQSRSLLPDSVKYAVASSFSDEAHILHVVVETDLDDNKEVFFDAIDEILIENWNFRLQIDVNNLNGQAVSDHNLWFIDSYAAFQRLLPWIQGYYKDSQVFYFIVLRRSRMEEYFSVTERIFSDFLELTIANVNVIIENASNGEVLLYTFFPYQENSCKSTKPIITHRWFSNGSMEPGEQFFVPKADNFHECPLQIRTRNELIRALGDFELSDIVVNYDMSLLELILVKEFAFRMNFTFEILNTSEILPDTSEHIPYEAYQLMTDGKAELAIGFFKLNNLEVHFLSKSPAYYLSWLVISMYPRPNELHLHGYWLFVAFTNTTWICIMVFFTLVFGFTILASKYRWLCSYPKGLQLLLFAIGTSMGHLASRKNSLRLYFTVLSLGSVIFRAAYQGKLFDAYRGQKMLRSPHSIKELFAENYTIFFHRHYQSIQDDINEEKYLNFRVIKLIQDLRPFPVEEKLALVVSFGYIYTFYTVEDRKKLLLEPVLMEQRR